MSMTGRKHLTAGIAIMATMASPCYSELSGPGYSTIRSEVERSKVVVTASVFDPYTSIDAAVFFQVTNNSDRPVAAGAPLESLELTDKKGQACERTNVGRSLRFGFGHSPHATIPPGASKTWKVRLSNFFELHAEEWTLTFGMGATLEGADGAPPEMLSFPIPPLKFHIVDANHPKP